ncbi:hypothetical protein [Actinophytocola sp. KF-1]
MIVAQDADSVGEYLFEQLDRSCALAVPVCPGGAQLPDTQRLVVIEPCTRVTSSTSSPSRHRLGVTARLADRSAFEHTAGVVSIMTMKMSRQSTTSCHGPARSAPAPTASGSAEISTITLLPVSAAPSSLGPSPMGTATDFARRRNVNAPHR